MNILFIGDIVGRSGREAVFTYLEELKYKHQVDFCIANGENSSGGLGMNRKAYEELSLAGIDYFTMGNHTFSKSEVVSLLEAGENIVRPANYIESVAGEGVAIVRAKNGEKIAIINLMGRTFSDIKLSNPFIKAKEIVDEVKKSTNVIFLDFHAEATSEKRAMGFFLDGLVSFVAGTHTHVQTNDLCILKGGTGYITDVGMTGPSDSILGMDKDVAIKRFLTEEKVRYAQSKNKAVFSAVLFSVDEKTGKCEKASLISI